MKPFGLIPLRQLPEITATLRATCPDVKNRDAALALKDVKQVCELSN